MQAQGQGSYGGIAGGFVNLAMIVIILVVALVLLTVRYLMGNTAALGLLALLAAGLGYLAVDAKQVEAKRRSAYREIERAFAEGCAQTTRVLEHPAAGDERIYIRLQGADKVRESDRFYLLPSERSLPEGVQVVTDVPSDDTKAIVVDIRYSRDPIPGSYPGFEWTRTRYELTAKTVPEGRIVARTMDMQARNGFCLGDLEGFLRKALNRPGVLQASPTGSTRPWRVTLPDAYVRANYTGTTSGVYLKAASGRNSLNDARKVLGSNGCQIKESSGSPPLAICGGPSRGPVEVQLRDIIGIHQLHGTWLLIYRVYKGIEPLTSMRVEQRLEDWRIVRTWSANFTPPLVNVEGREHLEEFSLDGEVMTVAVYWGSQWKMNPPAHWFTARSVLRVPLPGLAR